MKNNLKTCFILLSLFLIVACGKEDNIIGDRVSDMLWLEHKGAQMPILVEGNTASKTFILMLHGGPGGTSTVYNESNLDMSEPLEKKYAIAYWDQRLSGNAKGHFDKQDHTVDLMIEDTDKAIDLLKHRYGKDISIFLFGHSWGGYLGNAYLAKSEKNQAKVKGWIDVAGAHNIDKVIRDGLLLMAEVASNQITANSSSSKEWEEILDYTKKAGNPAVVEKDFSLEVNRKAGEASDLARKDDLIITNEPTGKEARSSLFKDNHYITNLGNTVQMFQSNIWDTILKEPLSEDLSTIKVPALLLWGKYDFVVPPSLGEEAFNQLGTDSSQKTFHLFEESGHSPTHTESEQLVELVVEFVEAYK